MSSATDDVMLPAMPEPPPPPAAELARQEISGQLDQLALQLPCSACDVEAGAWCRTRGGRGAASLHVARLLVVQQIFWQGWDARERFAEHERSRRAQQ